MESVATYSASSSRTSCSSVWSTLMTSSILRSMSVAKRSLIMLALIARSVLEDLWSIVVLGGQDTHEPEAGGAVELTRIEEHSGNTDLALELLEQRRGPIDGEQRPGANDEDDVAKRIDIGRDALRYQ